MKSFEPILNTLENLFIETLPDYIRQINIKYNDGLKLVNFENKELNKPGLRMPAYKFHMEEAEYTAKDRLLENTVFNTSIEILLPELQTDRTKHFWRYFEAINKMLEEAESDEWNKIEIENVIENKVFVKIVA